jgi:FkbM family methyltransferase
MRVAMITGTGASPFSALKRVSDTAAGWLRGQRVRWRVASYRPRTVAHRYGSARLQVHLADPMAEEWYDHDWPPLPEIEALRASRLRAGARIFNLGAHQGIVAMMLAAEVGTAGRVVAVEASPHNAAIAEHNRRLNGFEQITVVHAAVAGRSGTVEFNRSLNGQLDDGSGRRGRVAVTAVTLSDLVSRFGEPDVVFMDIEGAEGIALQAAGKILDGAATDFFIEVHVGCGLEDLGGSSSRLLACFDPDDYRLLVRTPDQAAFRPLRPADEVLEQRFYLVAIAPGRH